MEPHIYGVTEVNQLVKGLLDSAPALQGVAVRGELSNYKIYPSGHHYFTLKDQEGALRCVMFRGQASRLRFRPENGMKAVASGRITVFPRDGAYQLYCDSLIPEGVGDLAVAFQQLKEKLWKEGLFDPAHKKPLPPYPEKIAIVTSGAGAAVHDMIRILRRRYPIARVILLPVRVQGAEAPPEIVGAIRTRTGGRSGTSSSPAGAAGPWRTCGLSTTSGWPGPSTTVRRPSSPPWATSRT